MEEKIYTVMNRSSSLVYYTVPETHTNRQFTPNEVKKIPHSELEALSYQPGGMALIQNYFQITEEDGVKSFNGNPEPEYYLNTDGVKKLILKADIDEFLDCLDFAPEGVIDMVKTYAVSLPMTDTRKAEALKEKTGFDVIKAIENNKADKVEEKPEEKKIRRTAPKTEESTGRRTSGYNVLSRGN